MNKLNRVKEIVKLFMYDMPLSIHIVLYLSLFTWAFYSYKQWEDIINPVVTDFEITATEHVDRGIRINGTMIKLRDCTFKELLTYSQGRLVDLEFQDVVFNQNVSRVTGAQSWGWWLIIPDVTSLTVYVRHECATGMVLTKLYEGEI